MEKKKELLDLLCENLGCNYLSELSCLSPTSAQGKALSVHLAALDPAAYPLEEWTELLRYLAPGLGEPAKTGKEVKALLQTHFSG